MPSPSWSVAAFRLRWLRLRPRGRRALDAQVREELESHVAMAAEYLVEHGVPRDRAEHDARARFGDFDAATQRLLLSARNREAQMTSREWFEDLRQDVELAVRLFHRAPVFFAAVVGTLAVGIGANGAVFSILQSALLQPLPYRDPGRLEMLWRTYPNAEPPAGSTKLPGLHRAVYMPVAQAPSTLLCVVMRTNASMAAVAPAIRRAVHEIDPTLPAMNITTIDRIVDQSVANRRFYTLATAAFATIALVLTIVGLVVVVARVVAERRRELAIRSALGATMTRLAVGATASVMMAVCAGVVIGCAGAYAGAMGMTQFLFQVAPRSPLVYGMVAALVTGVAFVAAGAPVRQFRTLSLSVLLKAD